MFTLMEAARVLIGLFTASTLAHSLPYLNRRPLAALVLSTSYGVYVLAPVWFSWQWAVLFAITLAWSGGLAVVGDRPNIDHLQTLAKVKDMFQNSATQKRMAVTFAGLLSILLGAVIVNYNATLSFLERLATTDAVPIIVSGFLCAVFISHAPVVLLSSHFAEERIDRHVTLLAVDTPGIYIGWLERALVFIFIVGGQPGPAALAIASKSLTRYPAIERGEMKAEYFLLGTLASIVAAIAWAVAVRLALGLAPL